MASLSQSDPVWIPPLVNIGCGEDVTSKELAKLVRRVVGFEGKIVVDASKPDGNPAPVTGGFAFEGKGMVSINTPSCWVIHC